MSAAVIAAPGRLELKEVPVPEVAVDGLLIRVEGCGVCASNLPRWKGMPWFTYPSEPGELGHEGVGRVEAVGSTVRDFSPGDRVAFLSNHAYAGYDVANASEAVKLPSALERDVLPGEPLGCAWNVHQRSGISAGSQVAIVGGGFLGILLGQLALNAGAKVFIVSRRPLDPFVLETLPGVETIVASDAAAVVAKLEAVTPGRLCDVVVEAAGTQDALDVAAKLTRIRGRLVIAGYHQDAPRQIDMQLWNWRGLDVINAHEREVAVYVEGMRRAYKAVEAAILNPRPLITHHLPLAELGDALEFARTRPPGFVKAVVYP